MLRSTTIRTIFLVAVSAAALSACSSGGSGATAAPATDLVNNAYNVRSIMDKIDNLPEAANLTAGDLLALTQVVAEYQNLGAEAKQMVSKANVDKLNTLLAAAGTMQNKAAAISATIATLPSEISKTDASKVSAARADYDGLTDVEETWVDAASVDALKKAETTVTNNQAKAAALASDIAALPSEISKTDAAQVTAARANYDALSDSEETWVDAASVSALKKAETTVTNNQAKAAAVESGIATLPSEIAKVDASKVSAARADYDGLTDAEETWVDAASVDALKKAETTVTNNQAKAAALASDIAALPSEIAKVDASKVSSARTDYDALSDSEETWVDAASVDALKKAETTVTNNQAKAAAVESGIAALPSDGLEVDTAEEIAAFTAAQKAFDALSDSEETWVDAAALEKLTAVAAKTVIDTPETSLPALNIAAPLPSAFLSSEVNGQAQQFNPHMQLRSNGNFLEDQPRLIKELAVDDQTTDQDAIGLTAIGVQDMANPGNPTGKIERITKISADKIQTSGSGDEIDLSAEAIHRQNVDKEYLGAKWSSLYAIRMSTGVDIIMRDPSEMGWNYQTFAYYKDPANNIEHAYQSVGIETTEANMPSSGTATYKGSTAGTYILSNNTQQMTADVNAVVDFSKKLLRFETSGAQLHKVANNVRESQAADQLNLKGTASWTSGNQFRGSVISAGGMEGALNGKFYGSGASEIGGTYGLKKADGTEKLIGGYGAKRQ